MRRRLFRTATTLVIHARSFATRCLKCGWTASHCDTHTHTHTHTPRCESRPSCHRILPFSPVIVLKGGQTKKEMSAGTGGGGGARVERNTLIALPAAYLLHLRLLYTVVLGAPLPFTSSPLTSFFATCALSLSLSLSLPLNINPKRSLPLPLSLPPSGSGAARARYAAVSAVMYFHYAAP